MHLTGIWKWSQQVFSSYESVFENKIFALKAKDKVWSVGWFLDYHSLCLLFLSYCLSFCLPFSICLCFCMILTMFLSFFLAYLQAVFVIFLSFFFSFFLSFFLFSFSNSQHFSAVSLSFHLKKKGRIGGLLSDKFQKGPSPCNNFIRNIFTNLFCCGDPQLLKSF